jgi:hypothetical protein
MAPTARRRVPAARIFLTKLVTLGLDPLLSGLSSPAPIEFGPFFFGHYRALTR